MLGVQLDGGPLRRLRDGPPRRMVGAPAVSSSRSAAAPLRHSPTPATRRPGAWGVGGPPAGGRRRRTPTVAAATPAKLARARAAPCGAGDGYAARHLHPARGSRKPHIESKAAGLTDGCVVSEKSRHAQPWLAYRVLTTLHTQSSLSTNILSTMLQVRRFA